MANNFYSIYPPISGSSAANASVGTNGLTAPTSSTEIGFINSGGNLTPVSPTNPLPSTISNFPTEQNVNLNQVGGTAFTLGQALAAGSLPVVLTAAQLATLTPLSTIAVTQSTSPWVTSVSNFPATQPVSGTVAVSNFPATQPVSGTVAATQSGTWSVGVNNFPATQPVSGTVSVSNFPATQPVSGTVSISGTVPVSGTFFQATQPVSIASIVPVTNSANAFTDLSGTITTANTTQTVQSGRTRNYIIFQNLSTSTMYLNFASSPTANGSGFAILPYASFSMDGFNISEDGIYVSCATAGAAYECKVI